MLTLSFLCQYLLVINVLQTTVAQQFITSEHHRPDWNYHEIQGWKEHYSACGGAHQSPINLNSATSFNVPYPKLIFGNYDKLFPEMVTNNGHTAMFSLGNVPDYELPFIMGGGLNDRFIFVQMHFHWGLDSRRGSEHHINGRKFPAELHIVHFNSKYGSFNNSLPFQDGLAVLGILIELEARDNPAFRHLEQFDGIQDPKTEKSNFLSYPVPLADLLPDDTDSFYRYNGSLTTPACNEDVIWTVFDTPIAISERQLEKFRQLRDEEGHPLEDNFRPIQELYDRVVTYRSSDSGLNFAPGPLSQFLFSSNR